MDTKDILIKDNIYITTDSGKVSSIAEKDVSIVLLGYHNADILSNINDKTDKIFFITKEKLDIKKENVVVKKKITKFLIKNSKKIVVLINLDDNYDNAKHIIKNIIVLKNICELYNIKLENKNCIGIINDNNSPYFYDVLIALRAMYMSDINERLSYVYDEACDYLDLQFKTNNYCEFLDDDTCMANRNGSAAHSEMGCCYSFTYGNLFSAELIQNMGICKYLDCKTCSTKCASCKMFTCKALKEKRNKI